MVAGSWGDAARGAGLPGGTEAIDHWSVLLEQLPVGVVVVSPDGVVLDANPTAERLLGASADEQKTRDLRSEKWSVVRPDGSSMPVEEYPAARVLAGQDRVDGVELGINRPQGDVAWVRVSAVAAPTPTGRGAIVVVEDVSHLREAMERGDRAQHVLALACDAADLTLWRTGGDHEQGAVVLDGGAALRSAGLVVERRYERAHALERAWDDGARRAIRDAASACREGRPYEVVFRVRGPAGKPAWFLERGQPAPLEDGSMLGATLDITEQAMSRELLQSTERRVATVLEAAPDIISVAAPSGELRYVSPAVEKILGLAAQDLIGTVHEALLDPLVLADPHTHAGTDPSPHRRSVLGADGTEVWLETTTRPVVAPGSHDVLEFVSISRDATRQIQAYEEMQGLHAVAQEGTRTKSRFLANMSHEIRTPMNAILGMAHLALNADLSEQQRRRLENIEASAESLLSIINDILDHSKIEAGGMELESIEFGIESVLARIRTLIAPRAADAGVGLLFDVDPDTPVRLVGDPLRLGQILTNFASNAVKFTQAEGEVVLRVAVEDRSCGQVQLHFSVRDSGIGMSEEQLGRLFRPFTQADASTTRAFGGTGLGLTICKDLVQLMGGTIWAESTPGEGSTFHCRVSLKASGDSTVLGSLPSRHLPNVRVLVVDDHRTAREIFSSMLTGFGLRVEVARSGAQALRMAASADDADDPFDLVLVDWHMPGLDGVETIRRLHERAGVDGRPATILVTAYDRSDAHRAARGLVVDAFVEKPATRSSVFDSVMNVLAPTGEAEASAVLDAGETTAPTADLAGARLLVVEDNAINQQLAVELLTMYGLQPTVVNNGAEALDVLAAGLTFDGVLMDCQMPIMDGYEATRRIRAIPELAQLPIIAMTANAMSEDVVKAQEAGMNAHVAKPVNVEELFSTLAAWVVPSQPQESSSPASAPSPLVPSLPDVAGLDTSVGLAVAAGNVELYLELLELFQETQGSFEVAFAAARGSDDPVAHTRLAHTLKGTASSIGALGVAAAASSLEAACERHDEARLAFWSLQTQTCLDRLLPELGKILAWGRDIGCSQGSIAGTLGSDAPSGPGDEAFLHLLLEVQEGLAASDPRVIDGVRSLQGAVGDRPACRDPLRRLVAAAKTYDFEAAQEALAIVGRIVRAESSG